MRAAGGGSGVALTLSPNQIAAVAAANEDRPPSLAAGLCKQAPSGRAGVRLRGLYLGVCSGSRRREAPCGKRLEPMSQEAVSGVLPSTNSPDPGSIDPGEV